MLITPFLVPEKQNEQVSRFLELFFYFKYTLGEIKKPSLYTKTQNKVLGSS